MIILLLYEHILLVKEVKICRPLFFGLAMVSSFCLSASLSTALQDDETGVKTFV